MGITLDNQKILADIHTIGGASRNYGDGRDNGVTFHPRRTSLTWQGGKVNKTLYFEKHLAFFLGMQSTDKKVYSLNLSGDW
ncbi:hypothetical protein [Liquorilactobacillus nagelii]|uniref:hypothetical protein n=1 Tax=Liquorilactobacillus nagelii TaxID=82688 RepID=UPI001CCEB890|nr:hypothetical protein [Liquorilactobacillus nagelii]ULQ49309.1 hypothetical protein J6864_10180 [Liquorilactobacillus nagelii]